MVDQSSNVSDSELFAAYGEALYLAQSMENGLRIFYSLDKVLPNLPPGKLPRIDFKEDPLPELSMNSLGGFIRQFRKELADEGTIDSETRSIMRKLENAVIDRNWLVHTYWWDHVDKLGTSTGRANVLAELKQLIWLFRQNNELIRQMILFYLTHTGLSPDQIDSPILHGYLRQNDPEAR